MSTSSRTRRCRPSLVCVAASSTLIGLAAASSVVWAGAISARPVVLLTLTAGVVVLPAVVGGLLWIDALVARRPGGAARDEAEPVVDRLADEPARVVAHEAAGPRTPRSEHRSTPGTHPSASPAAPNGAVRSG